MESQPPRPVVFLQGDRIYLRPVELGDIPQYTQWLNDPTVRAGVGGALPIGEKRMRERVENEWYGPNEFQLTIVLREGNRAVGGLSVNSIKWKDRSARMAISIGVPDCRGKGYGTEAIRLVLDHAFGGLGLNRLELDVYANNSRAVRCYERLGFQREGVRRQAVFLDGGYVDMYVYGILAAEHRARAGGAHT